MALRVLLVTSEWPSPEHPHQVPFIVQQVRFLRERGIEVSVFAFRGGKSPINYLRARRELRRQHDLAGFDLIHMHFGQSALLVFPVTAPTLVTFWGSDVHGIVNQKGEYSRFSTLLRGVSRWAARQADEIIVVSSRMQALLGKPANASVIPHGVDLELFKPSSKASARQALGLNQEAVYVLFAANENRPVKRYALAKEAVEKTNHKLACELLAVTEATHEEMPLWMNAADCLLLTSRHEGSPTVVKEALACGLPVVSVDVGDVPKQLAGIENTRVCRQDDSDTITADLFAVLRGRKRVNLTPDLLRRLDEKSAVAALISVYRRLAGKRHE